MTWKVAKLSDNQLLDVREEDILNDGYFRKCETYRGGGGYDKFPIISEKRFGEKHHMQFIVQLYGCNLDCPYCYVTREGVWGEFKEFSTLNLVKSFFKASVDHGCSVFHLMGGAPALQLNQWPDLLEMLDQYDLLKDNVFHSDLMLTEKPYNESVLNKIAHPRALYAVDVKGLTNEEHLKNTRKPFNEKRFWENLTRLERCNVPYYFTFTNVSQENQDNFWFLYSTEINTNAAEKREESFKIDLIEYDALPYVDSRSWGADKRK